jgi:pimeloyl-ACP methyl ester carboxylesterase
MKALRRIVVVLLALVVVAIAALAIIGLAQKADTQIPSGTAGAHLAVDGIPIRYVQRGAGPDLLLLHGSPGSLEDWEPVLERLAARYRVTAIDRPGHGYSGGVWQPHTPAENARVALAVVRQLGLRDVVLVGHSYGAVTGLELALEAPSELRAYVLVAPRAYGPVNVERIYRLVSLPIVGPGLAAALAPWIGPAKIDTGVHASFGPDADRIPADFVARRVRLWTRPTVVVSLAQERTTLEEALAGMTSRYGQIHKPVTVIYGDQDHNATDDARLVREIPKARGTALAGTGHYVQYARPDELIAAIDDAARGPAAVR